MIKLKSLITNPIHTTRLTEDIFDVSNLTPVKTIPTQLYHATFEEFINSILKKGLLPSKNAIQNFSQTDKRFVYLANSEKVAYSIIKDLYDQTDSPRLKRLSGKINVITINTNGLNKKLFFSDPYSPFFRGDAIMYMGPIPTKNIIDYGD